MKICIYEDKNVLNLWPMTVNRPVFDLFLGTEKLINKILRILPEVEVSFLVRDEISNLVKHRFSKNKVNEFEDNKGCLFINARIVVNHSFLTKLQNIKFKEELVILNPQGALLSFYIKPENLKQIFKILKPITEEKKIITELKKNNLTTIQIEAITVKNLTDLVYLNSEVLSLDFQAKNLSRRIYSDIKEFVVIDNEEKVAIGKNVTIDNFVVFNTKQGPIIIEDNVTIEPHTYLVGPLFIGKNSQILGGKLINSSIGNSCKISGEINTTIFLDYSNKAHAGFIGHSYIGSWVNLGAMTTNSNLKNTYGNINLELPTGKLVTDKNFLGAFIGDYVKTGIGSLINTGSVIGIGCNLYGSKLHAKYVPSFTWGESGAYKKYEIDKFFVALERMMKRRGLVLEDVEKNFIKELS